MGRRIDIHNFGRRLFQSLRGSIGDGFGILKAKLKTFYNRFSYNSTPTSITRFLKTFTTLYNWVLLHGLS